MPGLINVLIPYLKKLIQQERLRRISWLKTRVSVTPSRLHKMRRRFQAYLKLGLIRQKKRNRIRLDKKIAELKAVIKSSRFPEKPE